MTQFHAIVLGCGTSGRSNNYAGFWNTNYKFLVNKQKVRNKKEIVLKYLSIY